MIKTVKLTNNQKNPLGKVGFFGFTALPLSDQVRHYATVYKRIASYILN